MIVKYVFARPCPLDLLRDTDNITLLRSDAVVPLSYPGCKPDPNGLCAYDTVLAGLVQRRDEIDFDHACFGSCASLHMPVRPALLLTLHRRADTLPEYGSIHSGLAPSA